LNSPIKKNTKHKPKTEERRREAKGKHNHTINNQYNTNSQPDHHNIIIFCPDIDIDDDHEGASTA